MYASGAPTQSQNKERKELIVGIAIGEGIKYGVVAGSIVGGGVLYANYTIPKFRKMMSVSAKTSLPLMATIFGAALMTELSMHSMQSDPEKWGIGESSTPKGKTTLINKYGMPIHHRVLNAIHDHPFRLIVGMGLPLAAYILRENMKLKHLTFSQRIMATRVYAQGGILSILAVTMGIKGYVESIGGFHEY
jgi:hypothetical protein